MVWAEMHDTGRTHWQNRKVFPLFEVDPRGIRRPRLIIECVPAHAEKIVSLQTYTTDNKFRCSSPPTPTRGEAGFQENGSSAVARNASLAGNAGMSSSLTSWALETGLRFRQIWEKQT